MYLLCKHFILRFQLTYIVDEMFRSLLTLHGILLKLYIDMVQLAQTSLLLNNVVFYLI